MSTTADYYTKAVERIRRAVAPETTGVQFLEDKEKVKEWIENQASNNSRKTYYAVVKSVMTKEGKADVADYYGKLFTVYFKRVKAEAEQQKPMDKEGDDPLTWDEVIKAREQLIKDKDWQNACLLGCYTYIPPRRVGDYAGMLVVKTIAQTKDINFNYCLLRKTKPIFIFNRYKTDKTYGQQTADIPETLATVIRNWREFNTTPFLFIKGNGDPYDAHLLSAHIIDTVDRLTGKRAGASLLRHAFITEVLKDEKPLLDKKPIAEAMAHSTATQELYARKL